MVSLLVHFGKFLFEFLFASFLIVGLVPVVDLERDMRHDLINEFGIEDVCEVADLASLARPDRPFRALVFVTGQLEFVS